MFNLASNASYPPAACLLNIFESTNTGIAFNEANSVITDVFLSVSGIEKSIKAKPFIGIFFLLETRIERRDPILCAIKKHSLFGNCFAIFELTSSKSFPKLA